MNVHIHSVFDGVIEVVETKWWIEREWLQVRCRGGYEKIISLPRDSAAVVYSKAMSAAVSEIIPKNDRPACLTFSQCVIKVPGCIIQPRIDISEIVTP